MNRSAGRMVLLVAAFLLLLVPAAALSAPGGFDDVPDDNVFKADIDWLASVGVTKGCNPPANTRFCPSSYVTREQMAAFMHRFSNVVDTDPGTDPAVLARLDALEAENQKLKTLLAGVSRDGSTLLFEGMNLQIVNGQGQTDSKNTLGNVIIGYNEWTASVAPFRGGSHYLVIGEWHQYRSWGGIIAGYRNTASGEYASVTGGADNTASEWGSLVTGGAANTASSKYASVTGGAGNTASGNYSSVTGGDSNTASGEYASVTGGDDNTASGDHSSVTGGDDNTASGDHSSVTGGAANTASGDHSSILGGYSHEVTTGWGFFPN